MGVLNRKEIEKIGFANVGENVYLSDRASYYNPGKIIIGNNVRIDDYCVLSAGDGGIHIKDYVHIAVYTSIIGAGNIQIDAYANISSRVSIYSSSDDYSGRTMSNPMIPDKYKKVIHADVKVNKHVIIGSGSIIMPGVVLEDGVAIGALSFVNQNCESYSIYAGVPAKKIKNREKYILELEKKFERERE